MSWYYENEGRATGPVSTDEFDRLIVQGRIAPNTLVWRQGMEHWQSLASLNRPTPEPALMPITDSDNTSSVFDEPNNLPAIPVLTCMQCGQTGGFDFVVSQRNITICQECLLKLQAGFSNGAVSSAIKPAALTERDPAPIGARIGAFLLDSIVFFVLLQALSWVMIGQTRLMEMNVAYQGQDAEAYLKSNPEFLTLIMQIVMLLLAFAFFYHAMLTYGIGGSLGKRMVNLRVVSALDGSRITFQQSTIRAAIPTLLMLMMVTVPGVGLICFCLLLIGYFSSFNDPLRRTWYDRLAKTRVIKNV